MDDTATDTDPTASQRRRKALRFLRQLAIKRSILPPSLFLNNLKREGGNGVLRAVGGGAFAVSFVSSVLRGSFLMSLNVRTSTRIAFRVQSFVSVSCVCLLQPRHSENAKNYTKYLFSWLIVNTSAKGVFRNFIHRSLFGDSLTTQIFSLS